MLMANLSDIFVQGASSLKIFDSTSLIFRLFYSLIASYGYFLRCKIP